MKKNINLLTLIICFLSSIAISANSLKAQEPQQEVKEISPKKLERKMARTVQLLDVRTNKEFSEGHLEQAKNLDVQKDDFNTLAQKLDASKPIYVYCKSGRRGALAVQKLKALGYKKVRNLKGGYLAWQKYLAEKK